jgi:hypothetical protein
LVAQVGEGFGCDWVINNGDGDGHTYHLG